MCDPEEQYTKHKLLIKRPKILGTKAKFLGVTVTWHPAFVKPQKGIVTPCGS
jgi:hypothetical protein